MGAEKKRETKCPWCAEMIPTSEVKVRRYQNDYGAVLERRCPRCTKLLAAYAEDQGDFLRSIRTF